MSIIGTSLLLATEEGGFGLNFNLLETNLINLTILIGLLVYLGRNVLGNVMAERRLTIETAILEVEKRQKDAAAALAEQQQLLTEAQSSAAKIKAEAEARSQVVRADILAQAEREIQRMKLDAAKDLSSQREKVIKELRQQVAALAMQKVESQLRDQIDDSLQQRLIDQSIVLLGGRS
ncbi:MAG: F0F1 ATP synthase subunit B [Leptolyngbyaceae cyanobacterium MO_188.B28]|nr:F0F1 ATP synthase subunit B [Leptolyngbyaceae cyanobacterium MO_188.B28]